MDQELGKVAQEQGPLAWGRDSKKQTGKGEKVKEGGQWLFCPSRVCVREHLLAPWAVGGPRAPLGSALP